MAEVGFFRRVAPALVLAAAGGVLLYLLPTGADTDTATGEDLGFTDTTGATSAPTTPTTTPTTTSTLGSGAAPAASAAPVSTKRVIKGDAINFRFGTVQVKIAMDGTTLINIATITAPGGGYQPYTDRAIPEMKTKILAAQSTRVAAASGATYTSVAYAQSVQSALDKA
ncbi:MAG: FMN-binding protein [Actinobacteria bacterium]|nr:FMN-binding protein [Actinomycetota bacterium]